MSRIFSLIRERMSERAESEQSGQAMVEYAIILVLVVIVSIGIVTTIGSVLLNELYGAIDTLPLGGD